MSSKVDSYYDWSLGFRKNLTKNSEENELKSNQVNSLGLFDNDFKAYIKDWKKQNL